MILVRLLILPFVWAFLAICGVFMLLFGGVVWVITGESYTTTLKIGN